MMTAETFKSISIEVYSSNIIKEQLSFQIWQVAAMFFMEKRFAVAAMIFMEKLFSYATQQTEILNLKLFLWGEFSGSDGSKCKHFCKM